MGFGNNSLLNVNWKITRLGIKNNIAFLKFGKMGNSSYSEHIIIVK
jgi:hypothetical protein